MDKHIQLKKWIDLRSHHEAGQFYLVIDDLELEEVAMKATDNDHEYIGHSLENGLLFPPTKEQVRYFNTNEALVFKTIWVEPFIFAQRSK